MCISSQAEKEDVLIVQPDFRTLRVASFASHCWSNWSLFLPFLLKPPLISSLPPLSDTNFLFMIHFHNKKQQTQNSTWGSSSGTTQEQRLSSHGATRTPVSPVSQGHLGSKVHSMWICETHHPKWWIVWHYSLMTIIIDICATAIQCTVTFKSTVYFEMGKSRNLNRFHPQNQQKKNILTTKVTYRLLTFCIFATHW